MSDGRRRAVRLSIFLLPALVVLAGFHVARPDLREAASGSGSRGFFIDGHRYVMRGRKRAEDLSRFVVEFIDQLKGDRIYGFQAPPNGFLIEVTSGAGASDVPGSSRILIRIPEDAPVEDIKADLSRLMALAMLRLGTPDADFSPWFEEGVSRYYAGTRRPFGSRKDLLVAIAGQHPPASIDKAMNPRDLTHFHALSHSITAFLHESIDPQVIAKYADVERQRGPVPPGEFERIFGPEIGAKWLEYIDLRKKGS